MKFHEILVISQLTFMKFQSPLFTFAFAFVTFKRWSQNFGFFWTDSKFQSFTLFHGESCKSQYRSYLAVVVF